MLTMIASSIHIQKKQGNWRAQVLTWKLSTWHQIQIMSRLSKHYTSSCELNLMVIVLSTAWKSDCFTDTHPVSLFELDLESNTPTSRELSMQYTASLDPNSEDAVFSLQGASIDQCFCECLSRADCLGVSIIFWDKFGHDCVGVASLEASPSNLMSMSLAKSK